jgi:hypothetical protein
LNVPWLARAYPDTAIVQTAFKYGVIGTTNTSLLDVLLTSGVLIGFGLYGVGTLLWLAALGGSS